jgi:hypothetical protein
MARRAPRRSYGSGPYLLGLRRTKLWGEGFPFEVPAVAAVEQLDLATPITLLAGDNGTGKSTVVEAIAESMGFSLEGGELDRSGERPAVPRPALRDGVEPVLSATRPRNGYFLRAESFFNVAAMVDRQGRTRPTSRCTAACPSTSSRTGSRSSRWRRTASGATGCSCSTSPRRRSRSPARWRCSRSSRARRGRARSS